MKARCAWPLQDCTGQQELSGPRTCFPVTGPARSCRSPGQAWPAPFPSCSTGVHYLHRRSTSHLPPTALTPPAPPLHSSPLLPTPPSLLPPPAGTTCCSAGGPRPTGAALYRRHRLSCCAGELGRYRSGQGTQNKRVWFCLEPLNKLQINL